MLVQDATDAEFDLVCTGRRNSTQKMTIQKKYGRILGVKVRLFVCSDSQNDLEKK